MSELFHPDDVDPAPPVHPDEGPPAASTDGAHSECLAIEARREEARRLIASGVSQREAGRMLGVSQSTVRDDVSGNHSKRERSLLTPPGHLLTEVSAPTAEVPTAEHAPSTDDDADFWEGARRDGLVVAERQSCLAVYENMAGNIVIRTERALDLYEDDDRVIIVACVNVPALIRALQALL